MSLIGQRCENVKIVQELSPDQSQHFCVKIFLIRYSNILRILQAFFIKESTEKERGKLKKKWKGLGFIFSDTILSFKNASLT